MNFLGENSDPNILVLSVYKILGNCWISLCNGFLKNPPFSHHESQGLQKDFRICHFCNEASGEIFSISRFYSWERGKGLKQVLIVLEFSTPRGPEASARLQYEKLLPILNAPILFAIFLSCLVIRKFEPCALLKCAKVCNQEFLNWLELYHFDWSLWRQIICLFW